MSKKKRNHKWEEDGFEEWGGYMAAKKAKLEEQFRETVNKEYQKTSKLFEGIAIFVNGYTDPTSDELRRLMMMHGGVYHHYMRPRITTHIIASNLPYSKIMMYKKSQNPVPICKPQWITDSIAAGKVLNFQNYLLYSDSTSVRSQLVSKLNNAEEHVNVNKQVMQDAKLANREPQALKSSICNDTSKKDIRTEQERNSDTMRGDTSSLCQSRKTSNALSTKDTDFLSAFYSNSRLHYISTMGATFKEYVNELRDKSNGVFSGLERLMRIKDIKDASIDCRSDSEDETLCFKSKDKAERAREPVIMHIDMDCFFVSVGIRNSPELHDQPVAVTHAKGNTFSANYDGKEDFGSLSEIASCSYAARKVGVKNGMFLGEALKLCPNLKTIQYNFEGYKEVSYILYDTVASYTLDIEAVSCDEMYVDCTKILETSGLSPLEFATVIREEIKRKTGCPVSTGFGNNKLQARLATRKAKPDNQFYLSSENVEIYIRTLNVRDLPGVGGTTAHKLREMNVRTAGELQELSLGILQREFGKKTGEHLYKMCRGLDDTKLNLEYARKSVSAEVNYGIRFRNNGDAVDFLSQLSAEVCNRLIAARAKGRCITLKLMVRAEEAPKEAAKFMGHGLCNCITKSKNLIAAVDDVSVIRKEVINIWNQLHLTPEDMRGIGIQISRLEICKIKENKGTLINFFNKTEQLQKHGVTSGYDDKYQHESSLNEKVKTNSSEMPLSTELMARKNIFDTKLAGSTQLTKSTDDTRTNGHLIGISDVQAKSSISAIETKHKNAYNRKANENMKTKDASEKSKRPIQMFQTWRHTKPNSGNPITKYEVPRIQDIDMSVLIELPADIRNEIMDECKRNKEQSQATSIDPNMDRIDEISRNEEDSSVQNCSQIDPDVLSALMKSDLHPDVQRDVQLYCNMKKEANKGNLKEASGENRNLDKSLEPLRTAESSRTDDNSKHSGSSIDNNCTKKVACVSQAREKCEKDYEAKFATHQNDRTAISRNAAATDKADNFILQNLNILHNNENIDKHQEMLINLVNHLFTLPLQQVKMQIQTWLTRSKVVNEVDFLSLAAFLSMLPQKKRIEDLHILLKAMHRCATKTGSCIWHRTYRRTVIHVQRYMQIEYNNNLLIPSIKCNDSRCNSDIEST